MISFFIPGEPSPKGSKRGFARGNKVIMVESAGEKLQSWNRSVYESAHDAMCGLRAFVNTPLKVRLEFVLTRPAGHLKKRKPPVAPHVKPDVDKLVRATLDPMTMLVFDDDSRIVRLDAAKRYAALGETPGCHVRVEVFG